MQNEHFIFRPCPYIFEGISREPAALAARDHHNKSKTVFELNYLNFWPFSFSLKKTISASARSPEMVSMSSLMILVLAATMCLAYPEKGRAFHVAQQQRCPSGDSLSCIDKKENDVCTAPANQYNGLACGVCSGTAPQCTLVCVANADQTGCMAEPVTCPKVTGIACGTSRVLVGGDALVQPTEMSSSNGALTVNLVARVATVNATAFSFRRDCFVSARRAGYLPPPCGYVRGILSRSRSPTRSHLKPRRLAS